MIYLTSDGGTANDARHLLKPLQERCVENLEQFVDRMDVSGNISLCLQEYSESLAKLPQDVSRVVDYIAYKNEKPGKEPRVCLRGIEYYLYAKHDEVRHLIRADIISNMELLGSLEGFEFPKSNTLLIAEKAVYASILDHIKHFSMNIACGIYYGMFYDKNLTEDLFVAANNYCAKTIGDYYKFVLAKEQPTIEKIPDNLLEAYASVELPPHKPLAKSGKWGGRKMNVRDLDHPGNILLYAGQFLDLDDCLDLVVNPLFGSFEVGHAINEICATFNHHAVNRTSVIRYSLYEEQHNRDIRGVSISTFVPPELIKSFEASFADKPEKVVIIDDGISSGDTVLGLAEYLKENYDSNPGISAVEYDYEKNPSILFHELMIPAIARRPTRIVSRTIRRNIRKIFKPASIIYSLVDAGDLDRVIGEQFLKELES